MPDYPERLSHNVPGWVKRGATYHIRIGAKPDTSLPLTDKTVAPHLLDSAYRYHADARWYCRLFLLMPDHLHALLAFPSEQSMSYIIGAWKGFQARRYGIQWQTNYFDHRIRNARQLEGKALYIRRNPVVKNLCVMESEWPWVIACG